MLHYLKLNFTFLRSLFLVILEAACREITSKISSSTNDMKLNLVFVCQKNILKTSAEVENDAITQKYYFYKLTVPLYPKI